MIRKIFLDLLIVSFVLGLIGLDRVYTPENLDELKKQAIEENGERKIPPKEFNTDGCTLWPQAIFGISWEEACIDHDIKYWVGGSEEERLKADLKLRDDVNRLFPGMGDLMYWGVRVGGRGLKPLIPWPWGWGYGWNAEKN